MWTRKGDWLECIIPSWWSGLTIEQLLKDVWAASKKLAHRWRMEHGVKLNGQAVPWKTVLNERDRLQLYAYEPEPSFIVPEYRELSILWEDDHLLVLNKEAGIDIHPSEPGQTGTLANAVAFYLQSQAILTKVRHIHRLDRDTSGAIYLPNTRLPVRRSIGCSPTVPSSGRTSPLFTVVCPRNQEPFPRQSAATATIQRAGASRRRGQKR